MSSDVNNINILAIESSCDETAAAVLSNGRVISNSLASQSIHADYGGVIPELASRAHQQKIVPIINDALRKANISYDHLQAVAFTKGPGLLGALLVGTCFAKSISLSKNIPLLGINHMQAHILSHFIKPPYPSFPFLCLTISGGHTQIVQVNDYLDMHILGATQDDAVGEAFDKAAKLLGLNYPGGPQINKYATNGNPDRFSFPDTSMSGLNYSFSGIKTALLYFLRDEQKKDENFIEQNLQDICAAIQEKLIDMLLEPLKKAARETNIDHIAIAGGVSANTRLREKTRETADAENWQVFIPDFEFCTDNAAMIAQTAKYHFDKKLFLSLNEGPEPRMGFIKA